MSGPPAVVAVCGRQSSPCGYCHSAPRPTSTCFGVWAYTLHPHAYQAMLEGGWRRSGHFLYLPDHQVTCCPPLPIRCRVRDFDLRPGARKVLKKVRKAVSQGPRVSAAPCTPGAGDGNLTLHRGLEQEQGELERLLAEAQGVHGGEHPGLGITLTRASFEPESFALYCKYQVAVHGDRPEKLTRKQYSGFLVDSPLRYVRARTGAGDDIEYGSYHQTYHLHGKLIAVGVVDLLPWCVSSVYFFYDPDYAALSLGTFSALQEIALTRRLGSRIPELQYYYLGYYIHSCPKMRYKAAYTPADLCCPITHAWMPLEQVRAHLDTTDRGAFPSAPGVLSSSSASAPAPDPAHLLAFHQGHVLPLSMHPDFPPAAAATCSAPPNNSPQQEGCAKGGQDKEQPDGEEAVDQEGLEGEGDSWCQIQEFLRLYPGGEEFVYVI